MKASSEHVDFDGHKVILGVFYLKLEELWPGKQRGASGRQATFGI
jgi:hypothetical protein